MNMPNDTEVDYEKQFQEDLMRATALSLEQQALDEYRRSKKYGTPSSYDFQRRQSMQSNSSTVIEQDLTGQAYYERLRARHLARQNQNTVSDPTPVAAAAPTATSTPAKAVVTLPTAAPRRHSEARSLTINNVRVLDDPALSPPRSSEAVNSDLISFSSPTAKTAAEPSTFERLIEDLQKMQTQSQPNTQTALVPLGPTAAAPAPIIAPHYGAHAYQSAPPTAAVGGAAAGGMQLVPYTPSAQQQKKPLTQDELQKLYNMPTQQQQMQLHHHQQQQQQYMGFRQPIAAAATPGYGFYYGSYPHSAPATAQVVSGAAAYMPPQYTAGYGFQFNNGVVGTQQYYQPPATAAAAITAPNTAAVAAIPAANSVVNMPQQNGGNSLPGQQQQQQAGNYQAPGSSAASSISTTSFRRQTPPARKPPRTGADLIDLNQDDDSRVSVLEAFDPLLNDDDSDVSKKLFNSEQVKKVHK